jgi:cation diffusion facilitator family transporter
MNPQDIERRGYQVINIGLAANVILASLKTAVGLIGHSPALLAEGINSTSDVAYYLVVSVFMRISRKPPDQDHPFGHGQLESIAALVVGSFVITTGIAIFWNSVNGVYNIFVGESNFLGATLGALWVALFTVVIKIGLTLVTHRIGLQTGSSTIKALAHDHRNDFLSASAATIGIYMGIKGYLWVDPLAGAIVAILILITGIQILRDASVIIMETVPSDDLIHRIHELLAQVPGVNSVEEIHARRLGPYLTVNITLGIEGSLSVDHGDEIATLAERKLYENIDFLRHVHIHYHPSRSH